MNELLKALKENFNTTLTENGATTYKSTLDSVYDMFALGGAYRERSDEDVIMLFKKAYQQDPTLAMKCLFYLRDITEGQGERRFFRVVINWLARTMPEESLNFLKQIPKYGRFDDLYSLIGTSIDEDVFRFIKSQLIADLNTDTPSLLAKWLKSENASSPETKKLATETRKHLGLTSAQYRRMLSMLRNRIKIVETLMSQNRWTEIEFDKIPSRAGFIYRKAFARNELIGDKYAEFMSKPNTTVNAGTLYPYEVVEKAAKLANSGWGSLPSIDNVERIIINKYWDNLTDYFNGATLNALAVVDTSGSMRGRPIDVAISLGLYCADKANGPFKNHFISFSRNPKLIETVGVDFCDKVNRIYRQNLCENTNIEKTFDLILNIARKNNLSQKELPESLIIISDMEFDEATGNYNYYREFDDNSSLIEHIERKWNIFGYKMPKLVFWNVNARHDNIPMKEKDGITFISGCSPVIFDMIMSGKTAKELMLDKLLSDRYVKIFSVTDHKYLLYKNLMNT